MVQNRVGAIILLALLAGCSHKISPLHLPGANGPSSTEVTFKTDDGWTIHADYTPVAGATKAAILLHQRNGSAADWQSLVTKLRKANIASLAVDQRGAGRSKGPQNGDDAPWDTTPDIAAGVAWLQAKGFKAEHIGLVGASYGANNALIYAASHSEVPAVVLLSPGTDYHGLRIQPAAATYRGAILVVAATEDKITEGGPEVVDRSAAGMHTLQFVPGDRHGTDMFNDEPKTVDAATTFIAAHL